MRSGDEAESCSLVGLKVRGCGQLTSRHCCHLSCDLTSDTKVGQCPR